MSAAGDRIVVAIVGATATGKTGVSEALARGTGGEIVCADSRQVFRELEIGTGKPSPAERAALPHHLFEALALGERATAGAWALRAAEACRGIRARGRRPILVGGSGLYLRALQQGLAAEPPHDPALRERLRAEAIAGGRDLHARLAARDPVTAARLDPHDIQRVMRALEVVEASGRPLSWWHEQPRTPPLEAEWRVFEITLGVRENDRRIAERTGWMLEQGLVAETAALLAAGHEPALRALHAVGYDEVLAEIAAEIARPETLARIVLRTRQLAKRQRTWFRNQVEAERLDAGRAAEADLVACIRSRIA